MKFTVERLTLVKLLRQLSVIFLRHATNRDNAALHEIEADQAAGKMPKRAPINADFKKRRALMLPKEARYDTLLALPKGADLGTALVKAMEGIERDFEPLLNQLPKEYTKFESTLLEDLLRVFDSETLRTAMIDARNIYRKVTRKIYDFTPEQLANLTAIVWLYRGQSDRFIALVQQHLERTLKEAAAIADKAAAFRQSYEALVDAAAPLLKTLLSKPRSSRGNEAQTGKDESLLTSAATSSKESDASLRELVKERDDAAKSCFAALDKWTARIAKDWE